MSDKAHIFLEEMVVKEKRLGQTKNNLKVQEPKGFLKVFLLFFWEVENKKEIKITKNYEKVHQLKKV